MKLLVICGPTASGKSALAVECARRMGGEVVSCDALLVYRGLNIGTAKPTEGERGGIVHHLIDAVEPTEHFSVSDFEKMALSAVADVISRGKIPVLCGGTGFYLNAVLFPSAFGAAPASPAIREKYGQILAEEGKEGVYRRLAAVDPESAAALHPNDVKRVVRALEIYESTGRKKSAQNDGKTPRFDYAAVAFDFPRAELYARIERRVDEMLARGLVEEVRGLLRAGVPEDAQCMQGIGYKEVVKYLKNGYNLSTMSDIIKQNTRNYAKRQVTFFKKLPNLHWLAPQPLQEAADEVEQIYECR